MQRFIFVSPSNGLFCLKMSKKGILEKKECLKLFCKNIIVNFIFFPGAGLLNAILALEAGFLQTYLASGRGFYLSKKVS